MNTLKVETEYYLSIRDELLREFEGKYVLIKGTQKVGTYDTAEEAYSTGVSEFGNVPFLIQKIGRGDSAEFIPYLSLGF